MIDLHTHTDESDGTFAPARLIQEAVDTGLEALAITDHDTLAGYDAALPFARAAGLDLVCGIELSTKLNGRSVHLLGYFLEGGPSDGFREWIRLMQESRRDRNRRLVERLRELGIDITLEEVRARSHGMTGRPHFAEVLVEKGYVPNRRAAFDEYLDESAKGYVRRLEPTLDEAIERIREGGGVTSLPHPVRVGEPERLMKLLPEFSAMGLEALEAYHSDHSAEETEAFLRLAACHGLAVTGGSDFHGDHKPELKLGSVEVPRRVLDDLRAATAGC